MTGEDVDTLQKFLDVVTRNDTSLPRVRRTGVYDTATASAVREIQRRNGLTQNGVTNALTWNSIVRLYSRYA